MIERLPQAERLYLLQAIEDETFEKVAGEAIYSVGVEVAGVSLGKVEGEQETIPKQGQTERLVEKNLC